MTVFDIALDRQNTPRHRRSGNPYGLTPREIDIASALGRGEQIEGIALTLGISRKTVATHRRRIAVKLGARNGAQLIHIIATLAGVYIPSAEVVAIEDFRNSFGPSPTERPARPDIVFAE